MARPADKSELLAASAAEFDRLWAAVEAVPGPDRERPGACDDWSVKDLLAHLLAWQEMTLEWERIGSSGAMPEIPAPGYSFAQIPELNAEIHRRFADIEWADVEARLRTSHDEVRMVIDGYDDEDLFTKKRYPWTRSTSVGSYLVSATSSHYAWASKLIRAWAKRRATESATG